MKKQLVLAITLTTFLSGCGFEGQVETQAPESSQTVEAYTETELKSFQEAFDSLLEIRDDIELFSRFRDARSEQYVNENTAVIPSIFQKDGAKPYINMRLQYVGFSWIFWDSYILAIDEDRVSQELGYSDVKRDNGDSQVWEYYTLSDNTISLSMLNSGGMLGLLEKIGNADSVILRFNGEQGSRDFQLSKQDLEIARLVVDAYKWKLWQYESGR